MNLDLRKETPPRPKRLPKALDRATPVLYMITPQTFVSPFDINMAIDAGYSVIMPYGEVGLADVTTLVQDAIFSRPPKNSARTGFFIGGKDINLALEMMAAAKSAMFAPFEVSVFADPGGSFTTAAAMVACVEHVLRKSYQRDFSCLNFSVFGASGVVGFATSVLAALEGARVRIVAHDQLEPLLHLALVAKERFGVHLEPVEGQTESAKTKIILESDVIFSAASAGVQVISRKQVARAPNLLVAADVNAVAPAGIEGMEPHMNGIPLTGCSAMGVGPLTIGDVKYKTQLAMLQLMLKADRPLNLDFRDAFSLARAFVTQARRTVAVDAAAARKKARPRPAKRTAQAAAKSVRATPHRSSRAARPAL